MEFSLWFIRCTCTGLLFFIGLKAPGLPRKPYMLLINEDERDVEQSRQVLSIINPSLSFLLLFFSNSSHVFLPLTFGWWWSRRFPPQSLLGGSDQNESTWQGFRKKVRLLVPYMWPRGNPLLQLVVIFCLGLLGIERAVNVFVPIYYKNIGESWRTESISSSKCILHFFYKLQFINPNKW